MRLAIAETASEPQMVAQALDTSRGGLRLRREALLRTEVNPFGMVVLSSECDWEILSYIRQVDRDQESGRRLPLTECLKIPICKIQD